MRKIYLLLFVLFLGALPAWSQVIRGYVFETATDVPVTEADVFIVSAFGNAQLQTDANGKFEYTPDWVGRFDLIISHVAYELVHLQALQLSSNKDLLLDIPMTARIRELSEVNVLAPSVRRVQNRFYTTTVEETTRFPATFFDPARTATLFPGVFVANDQANELVIHGLSPKLMRWYLEGVPILNPNHLANAGTLSDRASATGGGVSMLSNQVLGTTSLISGALPARYGDATSGVMDIQFRPGNANQPEHTVQAGLLGIEAATEGPLKSGSDASYLVNYRYSTVGILSAIGIDFGDEKINFQDLNFNLHLPLQNPGAYVKVFGVGGLNRNLLDGPKDANEREDSRDIAHIDFHSGAAMTGAAFQWPTRRGIVKAASILSYTRSKRDENRLTGEPGFETLADYSNELAKQTQLSSRLEWQGPRLNRLTLNAGVALTYQKIREDGFYPQSGDFIVDGSFTLLRPYGQASYVVTGDIVLRGGLGLSVLSGHRSNEEDRSTEVIPEPTLHIYWQAGEKFSLESGYSYSGITTPEETYRYGSELKPDLIRTHTFSFILRNQIRSGTQWAGIIHYYALSHIPARVGIASNHTILGESGYPGQGAYNRNGKGRTISLSLAIRQDVMRGKFVRAGIGWLHATHRGNSGILLSTPYDSGLWAYAAGGKEWTKVKAHVTRTFGVDAGVHWRGGIRDQEIDLEASSAAGYTVYLDEGDFSVSLEDYFRVDLRLYLRKDKARTSGTWSLDVQNLLSRENAYFSVYDPFLDDLRETNQLGIVPVLSYRVDF